MKNVLIYMRRPLLKPTGGPTGYNYNLAVQLERKNVQNIHFIESSKGDTTSFNNGVKSIKCAWLRLLITILKSVYKKGMLLYGLRHKAMVDLDSYDVVHFQSTRDMYACRDSLKNFKGTVMLTSHSPTLLSKEFFSYLTPWEQRHMAWFFNKLIRMDEYAFGRADYIVFPCEEAEEPYFNNWSEFAKLKADFPQKFKYLLTGTNPCSAKVSRENIRKKYGIPEDAFVVSYVGRHNELKGFDLLKKIGEKVLQNENVYILVAGKEEPIKGLPHERWIEVGWTNDPHSIIAASDMFLLPNRETYFDLVMLEVLSLGKIVVASYTGGNRYFDKLKPNGIETYANEDEAISKIKGVMDLPLSERLKLERANKELFDKYFSADVFADNYVKLIEEL